MKAQLLKQLLEANVAPKPPKIGELVEGTVIAKERGAVFLDLGPLGTGIIYGKEFFDAKEQLKKMEKGTSLFVKIIDFKNEQGYVEISLNQAGEELSWDNLKQKQSSKEMFAVKITKANKGGLICEVKGMQAFIPVSQLSPEHYPRVEGGDSEKILQELQKFVDLELTVSVLDLDQRNKKLILSERAKYEEETKKVLQSYTIGDVVEGEITGISNFGVFMKFQPSKEQGEVEVEGLIHISELDWQLIENPSDVVRVGETVKAKIIDIASGRVSLSLKALKEDPWEGIEAKYKKGDVVKGTVTKLNPFGAFVQLESKIQSLCHISEFESKEEMEKKLKPSHDYTFEILVIEPQNHRINLKLKA
jgi:small subunit ribosomal protein S1